MMFKTVVRGLIAQGQQEVVLFIVTSAEEFPGFGNELLVAGDVLISDFKFVRALRNHVYNVNRLFTRRRELDLTIVQAGNQRRIHQPVESDWLEINCVSRLAADIESGSKLPALRKVN